MANKKMTVVQRFEDMIAVLNGEPAPNGSTVEELLVFAEERKAQTIKKNASTSKTDRKPTATQVENAGIKEQILVALDGVSAPGMTSAEIGKAIGCENNYKISALLGQMVKVTAGGKENPDAPLVRTEVKGRAYFALAE